MKQPTILVIGVNHKYAPVAIREKIDPEKIVQTICKTLFPQSVSEFLILSTCNRTELYFVTQKPVTVKQKVQSLLPSKSYYHYTGKEAVKHILYVSSGLDSMILGETEIVAQIRTAYKNAMQKKTLGPVLHQLCKDALRVGKRTRTTTRIGEGITSIAQAAILLAKKQLGDLTEKKVLLIGAGDIAERVLNALHKQQIPNITVSNRTRKRAETITDKFGGTTVPFEKFPDLIAEHDVVISTTASPTSIMSRKMIADAMKKRQKKPLCLIDLAVPRDIEANAAKVNNVHLANIDAMQKIVNANVAIRKKAVTQVKKIIENEIEDFLAWYESREAVPLVTALSSKSDTIKEQELKKALQKLAHLSDHDKKVVAILAKRLESKFLARPIANLKEATHDTKRKEYLALAKMLFEL